MNRFKSIMSENHTKGKTNLHNLYTDRQVYCSSVSSSQQEVEDEKLYHYRGLAFEFAGTDYRTPENLVLFVYIPEQALACDLPLLPYCTAYEDYLLRLTSAAVNQLSEEYKNTHKNTREKPQFSMQSVNAAVLKRNGCLYLEHKNAFRLWIHMQFPLINGVWINGKSGFKAVKAVLNLIEDNITGLDRQDLRTHVRTYSQQLEIRELIQQKDLAAFLADGSILPRKNGTEEPMENAKPFISPAELQIRLRLSDGSEFTGMGLKRGITVITGGGYSGKSTLLDSLERGIYNHRKGDGREYVITDQTACKSYAEDGRWVSHTDLSPFFAYIPGDLLPPMEENRSEKYPVGVSDSSIRKTDQEECRPCIHDFSTPQASGSLSQAAGIIEAVYAGCQLLLIDEDTSATNFMIRDANMRKLVKHEPIIPFRDRIKELSHRGISTVLVIGGSSEYLKYADCVLLMEEYELKDRTKEAKMLLDSAQQKELLKTADERPPLLWMQKKHLRIKKDPADRRHSSSVEIDSHGCIRLNGYTADVSKLTAIISREQINSLAYQLKRLLADRENERMDLRDRCALETSRLFAQAADTIFTHVHKYEFWLEEVRAADLLSAACRLREMPGDIPD